VQGQLRKEKLTFQIESECGHCGEKLYIEIDSDLNFHVQESNAKPLVYVPSVNFSKLEEPSIIDAF
jgi:hypothetical protein